MNLYINRNLQINDIFRRFVANEDLLPYSIDESILDLTHSWRLFGQTPREVALRIQKRFATSWVCTRPWGSVIIQCKLSWRWIYTQNTMIDLIGEIHYSTVPETIWTVNKLTDVWGDCRPNCQTLEPVGDSQYVWTGACRSVSTQRRNGLDWPKAIICHGLGIDRSQLSQRRGPKHASLGNSQVLPRDYVQQKEIETVIKEVGEQVASRLRHHHKQAGCVSLGIGF